MRPLLNSSISSDVAPKDILVTDHTRQIRFKLNEIKEHPELIFTWYLSPAFVCSIAS